MIASQKHGHPGCVRSTKTHHMIAWKLHGLADWLSTINTEYIVVVMLFSWNHFQYYCLRYVYVEKMKKSPPDAQQPYLLLFRKNI